ncbi:Fe2OG dioxygenase domain-containing protein [Mycena sanguinolenta]|uniref:Fe2OG dioxygenase domain-containing protein n=1 Tax=Mycena sanguinolenta TaxID=230812 RepID=A0A8H6YS41_9AGAR|nr:Fe2OG dioxygenase domain-containing protein [Mycena sanguinolenta]
MGKKDKATKTVLAAAPSAAIVFPEISLKSELECRVLLENQLVVIDDIFSPRRVNAVKLSDIIVGIQLPLSILRSGYMLYLRRISLIFLPSKTGRGSVGAARAAHSFNSNIRVYKYTPEQYFGPHYDDDCRDTMTGAKSEWTLLIYLTGYEDGIEGGETLFYQNSKDTTRDIIKAPLTRGSALLHRHGRECLLHEGSQVVRGVKYVLRSDVMFM